MFCKTCPHFHHPPKSSQGQCRSTPPTVVDSQHGWGKSGWPSVELDDWCAHHPERQMHVASWCQGLIDQHNAQLIAAEEAKSAGKAN